MPPVEEGNNRRPESAAHQLINARQSFLILQYLSYSRPILGARAQDGPRNLSLGGVEGYFLH
jgi:hypothetical protein